jgi:hypothetical protein
MPAKCSSLLIHRRMAYMLSLDQPKQSCVGRGPGKFRLEKEAVAEPALFGWDRFLGHLTGGHDGQLERCGYPAN